MSDHPASPPSHSPPHGLADEPVSPLRCGSACWSLLLTLILIGAGIRSLDRLPVDAYPDLSPPMVEIITQWPGHAAEEVERLITVPVELGMNGIPQMTTVRSISLYGLSDVVFTFEDGTDRYFARQEVFNRMGDLSLPSGVTPSVSPLTSPSGLIYRYVLQSSDRSPMELKTFEDWMVEPQFKSVPGVADDSGFGGGTMQYQVLLDPAKIAGAGLSVAQVESALARQQQQCRRRFLFAGRPVLLRARRWAASRRWKTSATSCWRCTTARRCWSRMSAAS